MVETDKLTLRFLWKYKGRRMANTTVKMKNNVGRYTLLDFKIYYNATMPVCYWHQDRHIDQGNKTELRNRLTHFINQ